MIPIMGFNGFSNKFKLINNMEDKQDMEIKFNGDLSDISMLMISAERYALGRRTYIVSWICDVIKNNLHLLTKKDKGVIIRDIESAVNYGNSCDERDWMESLSVLKKEVNNCVDSDSGYERV